MCLKICTAAPSCRRLRPTSSTGCSAHSRAACRDRGQRSNIHRDRHLVVVQDHDQAPRRPRSRCSGPRMKCRTRGRHRDDRNHILPASEPVAGHAMPSAATSTCPSCPVPYTVIRALRARKESRDAAMLPQGPEPVPASGQNLVGVGLVADVPDDCVLRRIERLEQGTVSSTDPRFDAR